MNIAGHAVQNGGGYSREQKDSADGRYRVIVENANDTIVVVQDGLAAFANRKARELFGYAEHEYATIPVFELVHPEDRGQVRQYYSRRLAGETLPSRNAYRVTGQGGKIRWIENSSVLIDWDGRPATLNFITDITDRKGTEEALKESERMLSTLMSNLPGMVYRSSNEPDRTMLFVSGGAVALTGYRPDELVDNRRITFGELIHPEDRGRVQERVQMGLQQGYFFELVYRIGTATGQEKWVRDQGRGVYGESGELLFLEGFMTDITDRKRMETQLLQAQKMEAIGTLAGGIAHDFNNLLMGIAGYASLMRLDLKPDHRHYGMVRRIEEQVRSGADLTRQLLGFARGGRYEVRPIGLNDLISKTAEIFQRTRKEISLCRKLQADLWTVEVDPGQIGQVLMNLLLNACQAMPEGGEISLETENVVVDEAVEFSVVKPGRYAKVSLSDTGIGMDEQTRARIFEPFFTTREMGKGTGLGLAVVYGIVKGHNGFISVSSEPGRGTTFVIHLPASKKEVPLQPPVSDEMVGGREGILLVDDEKDVSEVTRDLLEALGYRVYPVGSGQEALAVYREKRGQIDLVILDMVMPGISGEETFVRLRELDRKVKVILSSGYSIDSRARNIMGQGCNGFLQKPYTLRNLSKILRSVLSNPTAA